MAKEYRFTVLFTEGEYGGWSSSPEDVAKSWVFDDEACEYVEPSVSDVVMTNLLTDILRDVLSHAKKPDESELIVGRMRP